MKFFKSLFVFLLIIVVFLTFLEVIPTAPKYEGVNPWIVEEGERPLIIPHGGAKKLYPENTVYAFEKMNEAGYDVFEVDLALTKSENILISHHDTYITVDSNGKLITNPEQLTKDGNVVKRINDLDYVDVYNLYKNSDLITSFNDNDETIIKLPNDVDVNKLVPAKLEDLFQTYPNKMYILELKDTKENSGDETFEDAVNELLFLIETYKMQEKVIVSSFDDSITKLIREKSNNTIMTSTATNETLKFVLYSTLRVDFFYRPVDGALFIPFKDDLSESQVKLANKVPSLLRDLIITEENGKLYTNFVKKNIIKDAHRHNMAIQYWTVNDKEEMRLLIEMGVDGIITDRPDLLKELLAEMDR